MSVGKVETAGMPLLLFAYNGSAPAVAKKLPCSVPTRTHTEVSALALISGRSAASWPQIMREIC